MGSSTLNVAPGASVFLPVLSSYQEVLVGAGASVLNTSGSNVANFVFEAGSGSVITLGAPFFQGAVSGMQAGDTLTLEDVPSWSSYAYDSSTEALVFLNGASPVATLTVAGQVVGQYATASFQVNQIGGGFNTIAVNAPAVAPTIAVAASHSQATVAVAPGMETILAPDVNVAALPGQSVQFTDGMLSFDRAAFEPPGTQLPELYRIYETTLGRAPDPSGENAWNALLNQGVTLQQVAAAFLQSAEYQAEFAGLSNSAFVADLYENGLGRAPEAGGLASWTGLLDSGADRASILIGISQSAESMTHNAQVAAAGVFTPS